MHNQRRVLSGRAAFFLNVLYRYYLARDRLSEMPYDEFVVG